MRNLFPLALAAALLAAPGFAAPSFAQDAKKEELAKDPEVQKSQDPQPTAQGTRAPNNQNTPTQSTELWQALSAVRRAPPDLNGNPVPRPNQWASEPDAPNEPTRSADQSDLARRDNKTGQ